MRSGPERLFLLVMGLLFLVVFFLVACDQTRPPSITPEPTPTQPLPTPSNLPLPRTATPTPEPLVARVNGEGISLAAFGAELVRYQDAVGTQLATTDSANQIVLDELINLTLLAQGAAEEGFVVDEVALDNRIAALTTQIGGEAKLQSWLAENQYDLETFRADLGRAIAAAWMRDRLAASVPEAVEQVHARRLLFYTAEEADQVLARLKAGEEFSTLAVEFNPIIQGDLGWFPRGYLMELQLEEVAFELEPEEFSEVITTDKGYIILQVIERDSEYPLSPDARLVLQAQTVSDWVAKRRDESVIEIMLP